MKKTDKILELELKLKEATAHIIILSSLYSDTCARLEEAIIEKEELNDKQNEVYALERIIDNTT